MNGELYSIGDRIREEREKLGRSKADLANLLGVAVSTITAYEIGTRVMRPEQLYTVAMYLGVPVRSFFIGQQEMSISSLIKELFAKLCKELNIQINSSNGLDRKSIDEEDAYIIQSATQHILKELFHDQVHLECFAIAKELYEQHIDLATLRRLMSAYKAFTDK